jgi:hypothetical protein
VSTWLSRSAKSVGTTQDLQTITENVELTTITEQVFCLPVPEKATRQWNFVVFANQTLDLKTGDRAIEAEQIVWTMSETAPANIKAADGFAPLDVDTYVTSTMRSLNACMKGHGKNVIIPTEQEFASAIPQSHRKGEAAYHVKAHKGSKDGKTPPNKLP